MNIRLAVYLIMTIAYAHSISGQLTLEFRELDTYLDRSIFELHILNYGDMQSGLNWTISSDTDVLSAENLLDLSEDEEATLLLEFPFSSAGPHLVNADVMNTQINESTYLLTGPPVHIHSLRVLHNEGQNVVFEGIVQNNDPDEAGAVNWSFDPGDGQAFASEGLLAISGASSSYIYLSANYPAPGNYIATFNITGQGMSHDKSIEVII